MTSIIKAIGNACFAGYKAVKDLPPSPIGKKIIENAEMLKLANEKKLGRVWHATDLNYRNMEDQVARGKFDKLGIPVCFALPNEPELAVHFGGIGHGPEGRPVLIKIASEIEPALNEFQKYYFSGYAEGDIYILEVYDVNQEYIDYTTNPDLRPTTSQKANVFYLAAEEQWNSPSNENNS